MKQRRLILIFLLLLLAVQVPVMAKPTNLLKNGSFENKGSFGYPQHWQMDYWQAGASASQIKNKNHDGKYALVLQAKTDNDIRIIQTVKVKGNTIYRFSGWVATEDISNGKYGANLCVMGGFIRSEGVGATTDWRPLELIFRTYPDQREVTLGARLGFYGALTSGTAFFDQLKLEQVKPSQAVYQQIQPPQAQPLRHSNADPNSGWGMVISRLCPILIVALYLLLLTGLWLKPKNWEGMLGQPKLVRNLPVLFSGTVMLAFLIRFPLYGGAPFITDLNNFKAWALRMAETGPLHFYTPDYYCDYPPCFLYIFWIIGGMLKVFHWGQNEWMVRFLLKFPSFVCDVATSWLIFQLIKRKNPVLGWILSAIYLFLPPVIYNSSYWGQVDTVYTFFMVLIFYLLQKRRPELAALFLAAAALTKIQTIVFVPLFLFYLMINYNWKCWLRTIFAGLAAFVMIILPFKLNQPLTWIASLYIKQVELYPYASMNAGNFMALLDGNLVNDAQLILYGMNYRSLGLLLFGGCAVWSCWYYWKKRTPAGLAAAFTLTAFAFFLFCPRVCVHYLFPVLAFLLLLVGFTKDRKIYLVTLIISLSYFLNMYAVVLKNNSLIGNTELDRVLYILGLVHVALFITIWATLLLQLGKGRKIKQFFAGWTTRYRNNLMSSLVRTPFHIRRHDYLILGAVVITYTLLIFTRLGCWSTPQKGLAMLSPESGVEVVLQHPTTIGSVAIYDAEGTGGLIFEYYSGGVWRNQQIFSTNEYYVMKRVPFPALRAERIRITPNPTAGMINEIAFLDAGQNEIPIKSVKPLNGQTELRPQNHPLFNEPGKMSVKPSYLNSTYFDEIYHGRTAYEFVTGSPVYENTHPPFGKDLLSLGILMFGMNPFGMRFIHAIMGILLILALFFLGRQILATRFGAYCTMFLGVFDFMPLVQSRYATIDTTSVLCISLMLLFAFRFFRQQEREISILKSLPTIIFLMVSFGLAAAIKWTAIYGFAGVVFGMAVMKFRQYLRYRRERQIVKIPNKAASPDQTERLRILSKAFWGGKVGLTILVILMVFVVIAPTIYYLSYIPYLNCQGIHKPFSAEAVYEVVRNQFGMYNYHSKLTATHPYGSSWWSWPFDFKPLWLYQAQYAGTGMKGSIVSLGNPFIWWLGVIAVVILGYQLLANRRFSMMHLVVAGFLSLYLPWVLVSRVTFIYHFYPALPLFLVMIAFLLEPFWEMGKLGKTTVYWYFAACALLLIMFYPVLTGLEVPQTYVDMVLRWFPKDWMF